MRLDEVGSCQQTCLSSHSHTRNFISRRMSDLSPLTFDQFGGQCCESNNKVEISCGCPHGNCHSFSHNKIDELQSGKVAR